jgi:hypothetical protein
MTQFYFDPAREKFPHSLPDADVFFVSGDDVEMLDEDGDALPEGWYYEACFPGCLPDSEPIGPFDTKAAAIEDARDFNEDMENDEEDKY